MGFRKTIVLDSLEYTVLCGLIEGMLQSVEKDAFLGTPKDGDSEVYPIYLSIAQKLMTPSVPPVN